MVKARVSRAGLTSLLEHGPRPATFEGC